MHHSIPDQISAFVWMYRPTARNPTRTRLEPGSRKAQKERNMHMSMLRRDRASGQDALDRCSMIFVTCSAMHRIHQSLGSPLPTEHGPPVRSSRETFQLRKVYTTRCSSNHIVGMPLDKNVSADKIVKSTRGTTQSVVQPLGLASSQPRENGLHAQNIS